MLQRIAHIDDDKDIRESVSAILTQNGYVVDSYTTMKSFLESLQNEKTEPSLALIDVMIETMDSGLLIYEELRSKYPDIPVIFMTSLGEMIRPYFSESYHKWAWIVEKPIDPDHLLSSIKSRLENKTAQGIKS